MHSFLKGDDERPRLLLVEDNSSTLALQRIMLRDDFTVVAATNFDEAVEKFQDAPCSVALLDIDLGEMRSGVDLLRRLREIPGAEDLAAVACTAYALPGSRAKFLGAGFNEYIGKPFTKKQLVETVQKAMQREAADALPEYLQKIELVLPPPPATFPAIVQMLARHDPVPDTKQLIEVLERDPLTVFWVLRHLNSAYYGLRRKVSEVDRAVAMLGHDPICNLVLTEVVTQTFSSFTSDEVQARYHHVLKTSIATAALARHVGFAVGAERPELAFSVGMLHQLGRMALLSSNGPAYLKLWKARRSDASTPISPERAQEVEAFGQDYARIGADLARSWHLHEDIIEAIRYHRDATWASSSRVRTLALLVGVCHLVALRMFESAPDDVSEKRHGILINDMEQLARTLRVDVELVKRAVAEGEDEARAFTDAFSASRQTASTA